jgi:lambda family phage portal protein
MFDNIRANINNIATKIKSKISPEIKIITKQMETGISAYSNSTPSYGSGNKWPGGMSGKSTINIHDHFSIRQKVRDQMYDSIEGRALVQSIVDTTVDVGMRPKPTPIPEIIGRSPEELELWSEQTAMLFNMWAQSKKSHRSRINNFYQNQRLWQWFQQRDNDEFVRFFYGRDKDLINPLQIEFVEPNQIRGYDFTSSYVQYPGNDDGIVRDSSGREIAYKIWSLNAQNKYEETQIPAIGEKSGRIFMIHGFKQEYAGQGRGYSGMHHMLQELENITDFKASTLQKAINQASFVGKVENEQQDASQPLEGRVAGPVAQYGSYPQPSEDALNVTEASLEPVVNWEVSPEATIRQPGSMLVGNLRRGDKMEFLKDTSPSAEFDAFIGSVFSYLAASKGWAIELVLKKFNQNYSASRGTLLLCWRTAQIERQEMIADFCEPVYEMWLSEEIAAGRIQCPGWSDLFIRQAWSSCDWSGAPMPNIDPLKTAQADEKYAELGAQTLDDIARNYNGSSGKANRIKLKREYEELPEPPWPRAPIQQIPDDEGNNNIQNK